MSSEKQIESARANGAKSKGPKSPEGKAASSRNATRHGILAENLVLDEESQERFQDLYDFHLRIFAPADEFELSCIETMVAARWRMNRLLGLAHAELQYNVKSQPDEGFGLRIKVAAAFRVQANSYQSGDVLGRYETRFERQYQRAYSLLQKYRAGNPKPPSPAK